MNDSDDEHDPHQRCVLRFDVGTSLIKHWEGLPYMGRITSNRGQYYRAKYDDDDTEELTHQEVTRYIQQDDVIADIVEDKLIPILQQNKEVPLHTKGKINELARQFLQELGNDQPQEQEENEDDVIADITEDKLITVLQQKKEVPLRTSSKINESACQFLQKLGNDVHAMICEILCDNATDPEDFLYSGLDSDRDTEAEVETIVSFFPEILARRRVRARVRDADEDEDADDAPYPIHCLSHVSGLSIHLCNLKAISFIPLFVRIAIKFGCFAVEDRGGLLCDDCNGNNVLRLLLISSNNIPDTVSYGDELHNELVDTKSLQVLVQLRRQGHLKKEDIQDLFNTLYRLPVFPEKRFRFLIEWEPFALIRPDTVGYIPLHDTVIYFSTLQGFRSVFEAGIRYFPEKKGIHLLFRKSRHHFDECKTPFQHACKKYGRGKVMGIIEDTLGLDFQRQRSLNGSNNNNNNSTAAGPYNIVDAFITAAIDEDIHLACVYFLLRRHPDLLVELLPSSESTTLDVAAVVAETETRTVDSYNNNGYDSKQRKRKRGG